MNFVFSNVNPWLLLPLVFLVWVLVLGTVKKIVFAIVNKITSKTANKVDDLLLEALDLPVQLLVYASGVLVAHNLIPKEAGVNFMQALLVGFKIVAIIAVILFIDKFIRGLIVLYAEKIDILRTSGGFAQGFVRIAIFILGGLILLDSCGISVTPIIASLGIGSLAVALALQPTLENFFSGIQLIADKPIQPGQSIRLESGEEGQVMKIGWRSTWICQPNNNTVIIPNKLLVNSRVTNFFYPNPEVVVSVPVGVHYNSDLDKVERVTLEVAREVMKDVDGGIKAFEPVLRFNNLGDFSIQLNVVLRAKDLGASHFVKHEFIKRLTKRYAREGIVIPFPTQTVVQEKAQ